MFSLKCMQADVFATVSFVAGVVDTDEQLIASVNNTGGKKSCENLREFSQKFGMTLMRYSEARGKLNHEKNLKTKISCQTPFKDTRSRTL
jgi:hypothetical protein